MAVSTDLRILVVDGKKSQQQSIKDILRHTGFKNITCVSDATEAISIIAKNAELQRPIELMICNDEVEGADGVKLFAKLKEHIPYTKTPFLLLCNNSRKDKIISAMDAGIRDILLRPFSKQSFINKLAKILR